MRLGALLHAVVAACLLTACAFGAAPAAPEVHQPDRWVDLTDDHVAWLSVWVDQERNWYECRARFDANVMLVRCNDGYRVEI